MPQRMQLIANLVISEKGNKQLWGIKVKGSCGNFIKPSNNKQQTAGWAVYTIKHQEEKQDHKSSSFWTMTLEIVSPVFHFLELSRLSTLTVYYYYYKNFSI